MTGRRKVVVAVAVAAGVLVVLAAVVLAFAPLWINLEAVHRKIESAAAAALGGSVRYERIDLSWFPRPEVVLRKLELSVPGKARGTVRTVRVFPAVLPLIRGRISLSKVGVDGLDLAIDFSEQAKKKEPARPSDSDPLQGLRSLASREGLAAELTGSRVVLSRPGRGNLVIEGLSVEGTFDSREGKTEVKLSRLSMESPRLSLEAGFRVDTAARRAELTAQGKGLDLTAVREKLTSFAGDNRTITSVFKVLRGGTLTSFSFASAGETPEDLGVFKRMSIHAAVSDAKVRIEGPGLDLADIRADVAITGGALFAEHASGRLGRALASDGSVLIGLSHDDDRLRVEAGVRADLAEVPGILRRALRRGGFRDELALVESLDGSATGRLLFEDRERGLFTRVSLSEMRFSARYRRLPWPVQVRRTSFFYDGTRVGVSGLDGSVGRSTLSGFAASVRLGPAPFVEDASGAVGASLDDLYAGLAPREGLQALPANLRSLRGVASVAVKRLSGPASQPQKWSFSASGTLQDVFVDSPRLPQPVEIKSGQFEIDADSIRVTGLEAKTMDAALRVSGALHGYWHGAPALEAAVDGQLGPEVIRWGWKHLSLPGLFRPAAPIDLSAVRVGLSAGAVSLAGAFNVGKGPRVTLDFSRDGERTDVRSLTIEDGDARATMAFQKGKDSSGIRFQGRLNMATIARLLARRQLGPGRIDGDFHVLVPAGRLEQATAEGTLTAVDFVIPTPAGEVTLEHLEAHGAKNRIDVISSTLVLDEQRFSVAGGATLKGAGIDLDMDVATGDLMWTHIEKVLNRVKSEGEEEKEEYLPPFPVGGVLHVSAGSFGYGKLTWKQILADLRLEKDSFSATVRKADLCGFSTTGEARWLPGGTMAVNARVDAAGPDVSEPLTCLGFEDARVTGLYEASLQVEGEGKASELVRSVRGPVTFKAVKGRISKANLLTRILGILNATVVFGGGSRTRLGDALPYDELTLTGEMADGKISIREATLITPAFTMAASGTVGYLDRSLDVRVLAHPLKTIDKVLKLIPVVRQIFGGSLLTVGVTVKGTLDVPEIRLTAARDVGGGLVNLMKRIVQLPVTIFDPPPP